MHIIDNLGQLTEYSANSTHVEMTESSFDWSSSPKDSSSISSTSIQYNMSSGSCLKKMLAAALDLIFK